MKKTFDFISAIIALVVFLVPILFVALLVKVTSNGSVLYWSDRVGINNTIFKMPKFRSMKLNTPIIATHLLENPKSALTPIGSFLRKTSLDELPQLWCILIGKMSFVGPRPALYNQDDLIKLRNRHGIEKLLPGLTGWAQVNGRDQLTLSKKVALDAVYLQHMNFCFDVYILYRTFIKVFNQDSIEH